MNFQKRSNPGNLSIAGKITIKILILIGIIFIGVIFLDRIDFPSPNKKIEKILPNENFKTIK